VDIAVTVLYSSILILAGMAIELQTSRDIVSGEVQLAFDNSHIEYSYFDNLVMSPSTSKVVALEPELPAHKMKALPQRPGPSGSRVVKKRSSIPHLGDGLLNALASYPSFTRRSVYSKSRTPVESFPATPSVHLVPVFLTE
jgi:hypothetical protein